MDMRTFKKINARIRKMFLYKSNLDHGTGYGSVVPEDKSYALLIEDKSFISLKFYPRTISNDLRSSDSNIDSLMNETAIILAGPIKNQDEFTLNTVMFYKKYFPKCKIVLSTWEPENTSALKVYEEYLDELILNKLPSESGWGNLNLQIHNTRNAIEWVNKNKIKYSIKTRTDCRIYSNTFFRQISNFNKIIDKVFEENSRRIAVSDLGTYKFRPYGATDIFQIGPTSELLKYWGIEEPNLELVRLRNKYNFEKNLKNGIPVVAEIFLCASYLDRLGFELEWNLRDWYKLLRSNFSIISSQEIELFWNKYDWRTLGHKIQSFHQREAIFMSQNDYLDLIINGEDKLISFGTVEKWTDIKPDGQYPSQDGLWQITC